MILNSCIYKVTCKTEGNNDFYIGSTCNFKSRCKFHKFLCRTNFDRPLYRWMNANGGYENFDVIPLAWIPSQEKDIVREIEEMFFLHCKPTINVFHPKRSKAQYRKDNKLKIIESTKKYYQKNKEKILKYNLEKVTCTLCGCECARAHLARHQKTKKCKIIRNKLEPYKTLLKNK